MSVNIGYISCRADTLGDRLTMVQATSGVLTVGVDFIFAVCLTKTKDGFMTSGEGQAHIRVS